MKSMAGNVPMYFLFVWKAEGKIGEHLRCRVQEYYHNTKVQAVLRVRVYGERGWGCWLRRSPPWCGRWCVQCEEGLESST